MIGRHLPQPDAYLFCLTTELPKGPFFFFFCNYRIQNSITLSFLVSARIRNNQTENKILIFYCNWETHIWENKKQTNGEQRKNLSWWLKSQGLTADKREIDFGGSERIYRICVSHNLEALCSELQSREW